MQTTYTDTDSNSNGDGYPDSYSHGYPDSDGHLYANSYSHGYANSYSYSYSYQLQSQQLPPTPTPTSPQPTPTATPTPTPTPAYSAQIRPPINADGTSIFNANRGVIPVKFTLTEDGTPTCALPPATIALTRTAGGNIGPINESVYVMSADNGSNFRIVGCQYIYNLSSSALGTGTYRVDIMINGATVGSATFKLK